MNANAYDKYMLSQTLHNAHAIGKETREVEKMNIPAVEARKDAILRKVWYLLESERILLTRHFLLRCIGSVLLENITMDEENECKDILYIGDAKDVFEVEYVGCTFESINNEDEVLLSCRAYISSIKKQEVRIALVQRRWRDMSDYKYDNTREYKGGI